MLCLNVTHLIRHTHTAVLVSLKLFSFPEEMKDMQLHRKADKQTDKESVASIFDICGFNL